MIMNKITITNKLKVNSAGTPDAGFLKMNDIPLPDDFRTEYKFSDPDLVSLIRQYHQISEDITDEQIQEILNTESEYRGDLPFIMINSNFSIDKLNLSLIIYALNYTLLFSFKYELPDEIQGYMNIASNIFDDKLNEFQDLTDEEKESVKAFLFWFIGNFYKADNAKYIIDKNTENVFIQKFNITDITILTDNIFEISFSAAVFNTLALLGVDITESSTYNFCCDHAGSLSRILDNETINLITDQIWQDTGYTDCSKIVDISEDILENIFNEYADVLFKAFGNIVILYPEKLLENDDILPKDPIKEICIAGVSF